MKEIYLLSCTSIKDGGGVRRFELSDNGTLEMTGNYPCDRPMYAVCDGENLHVLLRESFSNGNSGYFSIGPDLKNATEIQDTKGIVACHLAVSEKDNYIVNYLSGNVVKNCEKAVEHFGKSVHPTRQSEPHTHCVGFSPDKNFLLCTDLGLDTLFVYDRELNEVGKARVPDGYGIRHFVFSRDGKKLYAVNELVPSVSVFSYKNGKVSYEYTVPSDCKKEKANGAAIRLSADGKFLYVSFRVENTLCVYNTEDGPTLLQTVDCGGDSPRDFDITKKYLICANENSGNAVVFPLKDGLIGSPVADIPIPCALCVVVK